MSKKSELIAEMIEMQDKFINYEHANGIEPKDYFTPGDDYELKGYREKYQQISAKLAEMAHSEVGSKEFY